MGRNRKSSVFYKIIVLILLALVSLAFARRGAEKPYVQPMIVATSIPALQSLAEELLRGTPITVVNPFGNELSIEELDGICKQYAEELDALSPRVTAVITMRSVIPSDLLFINMRHRNIRTVEIDCATPLSPILTAVGKLTDDRGETLPFVWLSLSNAIRMAEVLQSDLSALFPKHAKAISANLTDFKLRANAMRNEIVSRFLEIENFSAVVLSNDFDYFLKDIDLFVLGSFPPEYRWTAQQTEEFGNTISTGEVGLIVNRWETGNPAQAIMKEYGVNTAVLNTGFPANDSFDDGFLEFWKRNAMAIIEAAR